MRMLILLVSVALVSACAAPHAARVHCDRHLVPINPSGWTLPAKPPAGGAAKHAPNDAPTDAPTDAPGSRTP